MNEQDEETETILARRQLSGAAGDRYFSAIPAILFASIAVAALVRDIPCGTKGGLLITFEKIEVVYLLHKDYVHDTLLNYGVQYHRTWIYDKIHNETNQFCTDHFLHQVYIDMFDQIDEKMKYALQADYNRYAPGIEIISVRVTKPNIPHSIRQIFEQMEEERIKVNDRISRWHLDVQVSQMMMELKLRKKDSTRKQEEISNAMYLGRERSLADADFYRTMKEVEANKVRLTPQYLELKFVEAIAKNSKMFFGDKVPNMLFDQKLLGSFLRNVTREPNVMRDKATH